MEHIPTPLTDALHESNRGKPCSESVDVEFARKLERDRATLYDIVIRALPFVEEAQFDPHYKSESVKQVLKEMQNSLASISAHKE